MFCFLLVFIKQARKSAFHLALLYIGPDRIPCKFEHLSASLYFRSADVALKKTVSDVLFFHLVLVLFFVNEDKDALFLSVDRDSSLQDTTLRSY